MLIHGGDHVREWLKNRRLSVHMTQAEVAKAANITRTYYGRIEKGDYQLPTTTAKKIAQVLGFDWTLFYSDPDQPQQRGA